MHKNVKFNHDTAKNHKDKERRKHVQGATKFLSKMVIDQYLAWGTCLPLQCSSRIIQNNAKSIAHPKRIDQQRKKEVQEKSKERKSSNI